MTEHYQGRLEGVLEVVKTKNIVLGTDDYLLKLTLDDGNWLPCHGKFEVKEDDLRLNGARVIVEGWILRGEEDESPLLVAADSIRPA